MKLFITGGSGFVGGHLLRRLHRDGHELVASARSSSAAEAVVRAGATCWHGELGDMQAVSRALSGCDAVIHAAAHLRFWGPWADFEATNVGLTHTLLEAASRAGVPAFVHIGAASVVMRQRGAMLGVDERAPLVDSPLLPYSTTKARADTSVLKAASASMRTVVLRPPLIWGRGDTVDGELGWAIKRGRFGWFSGGHHPYATCHIANLAEAVVRALHAQVSGQAFFVSDGEPIELRSFLARRVAAAGLPVTRVSLPTSAAWAAGGVFEFAWRTLRLPNDPPLVRETVRLMGYPFTVDIGRAQQRLGYAPVVGIDAGLNELASQTGNGGQAHRMEFAA